MSKKILGIIAIILSLFLIVPFSSCSFGENDNANETVKEETDVRAGWLLTGIPSYEGGMLSSKIYNCGPGMMSDALAVTGEDSYMQIASRTTAEEFESYLEKLRSYGYTEIMKNQIEDNLFAQYKGGDKLIYVYFMSKLNNAKIIYDKSSVSLDEFSYSYTALEGEDTTIYQYGLYQAGGTINTVNCGMNYIIKLADNSIIMVDGGHLYQASDKAAEGLINFMHEITGTVSGEKIRIAALFITHAHNDHMTMASKILHKYHNEINLERVMFNFPSYQTKSGGYSIYYAEWFKHIITTYHPNAKYMKLHTGQKFSIADVGIEVLYTHEDAVRAANASVCTVNDFNCTSTILTFDISGKKVMMLGDTNTEAEDIIKDMYTEAAFKSDMVQIAHHCFNYLRTLYKWIDADIALLPNSFGNANSAGDNLPKLQDIQKYTDKDDIYYEGSGTYGFTVIDGEFQLTYESEVVGRHYDGSGI